MPCMSCFAGEFVFAGGGASVEAAEAMASGLARRGALGLHSFLSGDGRCAMAVGGAAAEAKGGVVVALAGRIFNGDWLWRQVRQAGSGAGGQGDVDLVAHLYAADGAEMVARLEGPFAFVLYDGEAGRLMMARDAVGHSALWYRVLGDRIVFSSEAAGVLAHPAVESGPGAEAISAYLTMGYVPSPWSIHAGVRKLPAGHYLAVTDRVEEPVEYWSPQVAHAAGVDVTAGASDDELVEEVRAAVRDAVEVRMPAGAPTAVLLGDGVESSLITAIAAAAAAGSAGRVRTFTAGFEGAAYDERPAAALVAEHCETEHTELAISPTPDVVAEVCAMGDEPFGDPDALATYLICEAAGCHTATVLAGGGGDEVFAGYRGYGAVQAAEVMGPMRFLGVRLGAALLRPWARGREDKWLGRFVRFADALPHPLSVQHFIHRRLFGPGDLERLLTEEFMAAVDIEAPAKWFCDLYEVGEFEDEVTRAQYHDLVTYVPDDLLVKMRLAAGGVPLEVRLPLLDRRVVRVGMSLPLRLKITRRRGKAVLRRAFGHMLPAWVFGRSGRSGGVPLARWLAKELRDVVTETLLDSGLRRRGIFQAEALEGLINDHVSGRDDHSRRLWALLVLARWLATF